MNPFRPKSIVHLSDPTEEKIKRAMKVVRTIAAEENFTLSNEKILSLGIQVALLQTQMSGPTSRSSTTSLMK